jgi:peptidoglycan/LPS O-acetylase OafA/YrhL
MLQKVLQYLSMDRSINSFHGLDGLRALAILLVLCQHGPDEFYLNQVFLPLPLLLDLFSALYHNGRLGVDLFFVLSGFLITSQLLKFFESGKPLTGIWRFFVNRILRIAPAFYIILLFVQFVKPHIYIFDSVPMLLPGFTIADIPKLIWVQYAFMQDFFGVTFLQLFWTLGVEEKFYLLSPFMVGLIYFKFKSNKYALWASLIILLMIPMFVRLYYLMRFHLVAVQAHYGPFRFTYFHMRSDGLIMGLICAFIFHYYRNAPFLSHAQSSRILLGIGSLITVMLLCFTPYGKFPSFITMQWSGLLSAIGFGFLLLGVILLPNEKCGWLGSRPLYFIARISYSIYLTHFLWAGPLTVWGMQQVAPIPWQLDGGVTTLYFIIYMGLYLGLSIFMGALYFYCVEKPFLLLKDHWFKGETLLNKNKT